MFMLNKLLFLFFLTFKTKLWLPFKINNMKVNLPSVPPKRMKCGIWSVQCGLWSFGVLYTPAVSIFYSHVRSLIQEQELCQCSHNLLQDVYGRKTNSINLYEKRNRYHTAITWSVIAVWVHISSFWRYVFSLWNINLLSPLSDTNTYRHTCISIPWEVIRFVSSFLV